MISAIRTACPKIDISTMRSEGRPPDLEGARVLILTGAFRGQEGVCLGELASGTWAISPEGSDEILSLVFEKDFGLVVDLSGDPTLN
jgi:hypothetical protein